MILGEQWHETKVAVILRVKEEKMAAKLVASCLRMITYKPAQAIVRKKQCSLRVVHRPATIHNRNLLFS